MPTVGGLPVTARAPHAQRHAQLERALPGVGLEARVHGALTRVHARRAHRRGEHQRNRLTRLEGRIEEALDASDGRLQAMADGLQALRGVSNVVATTLVSEIADASRFGSPCQLTGYAGIVPKEPSSGGPGKSSRGAITKTGNAHLRRVLTEAAWTYRNKPRLVGKLLRRQEGLPESAQDIAWKRKHGCTSDTSSSPVEARRSKRSLSLSRGSCSA
jgi:transposase